MGVLEEAIREHLELRRLHGADPGEIERKEQAALGAPDAPSTEPSRSSTSRSDASYPRNRIFDHNAPSSAQADPVYASEETVEIDMRLILEIVDDDVAASNQPRDAAPTRSTNEDDNHEHRYTELHDFDWETPKAHVTARRGSRREIELGG